MAPAHVCRDFRSRAVTGVTELLMSYKKPPLLQNARENFTAEAQRTYLVIYREIYLKRVREGKHKPEEKV